MLRLICCRELLTAARRKSVSVSHWAQLSAISCSWWWEAASGSCRRPRRWPSSGVSTRSCDGLDRFALLFVHLLFRRLYDACSWCFCVLASGTACRRSRSVKSHPIRVTQNSAAHLYANTATRR